MKLEPEDRTPGRTGLETLLEDLKADPTTNERIGTYLLPALARIPREQRELTIHHTEIEDGSKLIGTLHITVSAEHSILFDTFMRAVSGEVEP